MIYIRSKRGTIAAFLLVLAIFGLLLVLGLIMLDMFVKNTTLSRIQAAAQAASLVYAREIVKLRDNEMGMVQNYNLTFDQTQFAQGCQTRTGYQGCTTRDNNIDQIQGSNFIEYIRPSQVLLFQVSSLNQQDQDAESIRNVTQEQCYIQPNLTRFTKTGTPPNCSGNIGVVVSPITDLRWEFAADRYGQGICRRQAGIAGQPPTNNSNKDFCVEITVTGRLDPILSDGLPFLNQIAFIRRGEFTIVSRSVVMMPNFNIDAQSNNDRTNRDIYLAQVGNYSTDIVSLEACNSRSPQGGPLVQIKLFFIFILTLMISVSGFTQIISSELDKKQPIQTKKKVGITEIKHVFWIKIWEEQSNFEYVLSQQETLSKTINANKPNILIEGSLVLKHKNSADKCIVKLPSNQLISENINGDKIYIQIKGYIGDKMLSAEEFTKPLFNDTNEVKFRIEGIIDPLSINPNIIAGKYSFADNLKLIVQFL